MGKKLIDLTGSKFNEWLVICRADGYKTATWKCRCSCGVEKDVNGQNLREGKSKSCGAGCHFVSEDDVSSRKQNFLEKALNRFGTQFDYSRVYYINQKLPVEIRCNVCGTIFDLPPERHLARNGGCPTCTAATKKTPQIDLTGKVFGELIVQSYSGDGRWRCVCGYGKFVNVKSSHLTKGQSRSCGCARSGTLEDFINEAEVVQGSGVYDYSGVVFKTLNTKVAIRCIKHDHIFYQKPCNHLKGHGCPKCGLDKTKQLQRKTKEQFVADAQSIHGDKYDYSSSEYVNVTTAVEIKCKTCDNVFHQTPNAHLSGKGCHTCAKYGFDNSIPGTLYVLRCHNLTKVGITNKEVHKRVKYINGSYGDTFTVVKEYHFCSGKECSDIETSILRVLRSEYNSPSQKFDGYTECFIGVDLDNLFAKIDNIRGEYGRH